MRWRALSRAFRRAATSCEVFASGAWFERRENHGRNGVAVSTASEGSSELALTVDERTNDERLE